MLVDFSSFTDAYKELFLKIWYDKGYYLEPDNVDCPYCAPWEWYGGEIEVEARPDETLLDIMPRVVTEFYDLYICEIAKHTTEYFEDIAKGYVDFPDYNQLERELSIGDALARDLLDFGYRAESSALLNAMAKVI